MKIHTFDYDADNASIINSESRQNSNGETINRVTFSNGVVFVYIEDGQGFKNLDTNYVLVKQPNGYYKSDLNEPKQDFNDYY